MNRFVAISIISASLASGSVQAIVFDSTNIYNFTGNQQTFTVASGVNKVHVRAWGAQGRANSYGVRGGYGGYAEGDLSVTANDSLAVFVGGGGSRSNAGGWNGGGQAGYVPNYYQRGGGGGGASDVRVGGSALANRAIVAAGGGGAGGNRVYRVGRGGGGGGGGGYYGGGGGAGAPYTGRAASGGTQSSGGAGGTTSISQYGARNGYSGSLGRGGNGGSEVSSSQAGSYTAAVGGYGGGTHGGNGGISYRNWAGGSGAGGSSYIGGVSSGVTSANRRAGNGLVIFDYNLPELSAIPSASLLDFGLIDINEMATLSSAVTLANIGGWGTFIDIIDVSFGGTFASAFSVISGDVSATLDDSATTQIFDLKFDATGLGPGLIDGFITFTTSQGSVSYELQSRINGPVSAVPEPASIALIGLGLLGFGFARKKQHV